MADKSICYHAAKILNLFYESMRTIESINDFKRARKNYLLVVYSLNYVL